MCIPLATRCDATHGSGTSQLTLQRNLLFLFCHGLLLGSTDGGFASGSKIFFRVRPWKKRRRGGERGVQGQEAPRELGRAEILRAPVDAEAAKHFHGRAWRDGGKEVENGMITDEGTHECLLDHPGTYRRLYDLQFVDVETATGTE